MSNQDLQSALDKRFQEALESSNFRIALNLQKKNAQLKLKSALVFAINGGTFTIDQQLISFVGTLISLEKSSAVLLDVNSNPIFIEDLNLFLEKIIDVYYEATNEYLTEIKSINKSRNPKALIGEK
jgi:hypothetical protein